jgi:predicted lipoprotein with Yx(FWY)xxD motif
MDARQHPRQHPREHARLHRAPLFLLLTITAAAATLAACASPSGTSAGAGSTARAVSTSIGPTGTVGAARTALGTVLVDSRGRTLYELSVDSATKIVCTAMCAALWPPYTVPAGGHPSAGGGVDATLSLTQRPDGTMQVTANGHPLYTYSGDSAAGQTNGQGVQDTGGTWHALTTSGAPVMSAGQPASQSASPYAHY